MNKITLCMWVANSTRHVIATTVSGKLGQEKYESNFMKWKIYKVMDSKYPSLPLSTFPF